MTNSAEAIVGIGVPGCGKTTFLKPLAAKLGYAYVNGDDIREAITGDPTNHSKEELVWELARERIQAALQQTGVVIDATYTKIRDRKDIIAFCKVHGATTISAYWFNPPFKTCITRNAGRLRQVPAEVLEKMYNRLTINPPTVAEGFDSITVITQ